MGAAGSININTPQEAEVYERLKGVYDAEMAKDAKMSPEDEAALFSRLKAEFDMTMSDIAKAAGQDGVPAAVVDVFEARVHGDAVAPDDFSAGDIVKVKQGHLYFEGVVVAHKDGKITVDFGEEAFEECDPADMVKVQNWDVLEQGDKVQVKQGYLKFLGRVESVQMNGKYTVVYEDGEKEEDVEGSNIVKIMSARNRKPGHLWKLAINSVVASRAFSSLKIAQGVAKASAEAKALEKVGESKDDKEDAATQEVADAK
mmetsp:Transcript_34068/g.107414  ORF Transcript_34068/g.107414 Transcript_34068/m.107414 type:complete len:258 (-) Transcript_34068:329-1102(-)|eukprot:CAMPEP_0118881550 /NCGR_PEP_ID=MMETSP1163-20130328/21010_1 /TAXON_ID=124430 /ORGANISM="Phaeomonas parva, Strain CCMP2877" /LENGTH=257 /DNA_ID=CAMNT_0006818365 /DNA_START=109 /DNA_END=882 /DNA_ORIENTATION=-